jgi:serine/threonine-protein kinase
MQACRGCGTALDGTGRFCPACGDAAGTAPDAASRGDAAGSLIGRTVGDFAIDAVIGGGSFGTVYRGHQLGLDRPVALKVPTYEIAADPVHARRFAREARAAARIVHPGVVAIYAVGELDDGRPYLAMQLIDGEPLDRVLGDGPVPALRALHIARDVASALSETHAAGVVHRDLKPTNIMWRCDRNGDDRITLVDFGIAMGRPGHADASRLTSNGLIGTPHYMSPEQAQGEAVDGRSDLYALGCVVFELVTGATPFEGSGFEVLLEHLGRPAPRASERNPDVPEAVDQLILRLMEKKPDDRPATADLALAMIDDAIDAVLVASGGRPASASAARRARPRSDANTLRRDADPGGAPPHAAPVPQAPPVPRVPPSAAAATRRLPDPASSARSMPELTLARAGGARRWLAIAVALAALSGAGFAAWRLRGAADPDEPEPAHTASGAPVSPNGEALREIPRDDGELIIRTLIPQVIHAGAAVHAHLEITTKLGGPFSAKQVVITVEDPQHNATAQTAAMHSDRAGHYAFRHTFAQPGSYVIRIFPSETETVSTIDVDVVP